MSDIQPQSAKKDVLVVEKSNGQTEKQKKI